MRINATMLRRPPGISAGRRSAHGHGDLGTLRVASVPENHVYVRHIGVPGDRVMRLDDPPPAEPANPGVWWPPRMLDVGWIRQNAYAFDVFHLHFGFDAKAPADLAAVVATLRELEKPFVYTVHDLRNPHHSEPELHDRQLDVLVPAADALITLTAGAAAEIAARWGRKATVLPHPYVVDEPWRSVPRPSSDKFIVGVHAKSVRANMAPGPVVNALRPIVQSIPNGWLRVDVHTDVLTPGSPNHRPTLPATSAMDARISSSRPSGQPVARNVRHVSVVITKPGGTGSPRSRAITPRLAAFPPTIAFASSSVARCGSSSV